MKIRNICRTAVILGLMSVNSYAETKADWMQGHWGVSYRISGGDVSFSNSLVDNYQVKAVVEQIAAIPGLKWVQLNLTNGANGDRFIVPVPEVEAINPMSAPNSINDLYDPTLPGQDLFEQMAIALQAKGIKVFAYIATQGPAMLKHGAEGSMDHDDSIENCKSKQPEITDANTQVYCSANMNRWRDHVLANYPSTSLYRSFQLSLVNIVETLAARYGSRIDGWWFDHSGLGDATLLHAAVLAGNSNAIVSFNQGQKIPLENNPDTMEDFTSGHPTPIAQSVSSDDINTPMLTSIEATANGVFNGVNGDADTLGHLFMPLQETWNNGTVVYSEAKGSDRLNRALKAGGTLTWSVKQSGDHKLGEPLVLAAPQVKMLERMQLNIGKQLHMNLDGADGSIAYDESVNQYTATVSGAAFIDDITRGKVASFTEDDELNLDNYNGVISDHARTSSAWIKTSDSKGDIIEWGTNKTGERWWLRLANGKLKLILQDSNVVGSTVVNDNEWHHITVVAPDNVIGNIKLYVDGVLETTELSGSTSATFDTASDSNVKIGGQFTGLIDKVMIHDRALAEDEINYIVHSENSDLDLELALDIRFDDAVDSAIVNDSSAFERFGTNQGAFTSVYDGSRDSNVYSFDGNASVVMTPEASSISEGYNGVNGGDPRTVMAWIKTTDGNGIITQWGNTSSVAGEQYIIRLRKDVLKLSIQGASITGTTPLNDGQWHHVAFVSPDDQLANTKFYIDGVLEATSVGGADTIIDTNTLNADSRDVLIGNGFIGEIDDFIIHQRALKPFEIKNTAGL